MLKIDHGSSVPDASEEEALAAYLIKTHMAEARQINDASDAQKMAAEHGLKLPLAEALVRLGVITANQRLTVEKVIHEERSPQLGNYKIIKKLGSGAMGNVFLAEDTLAQRMVALKVLSKTLAGSEEYLTRFRKEAQAMGRLNHVNIISAFTVGEDKGKHFYVMEYCEGESVDVLLKRQTTLSPGEALQIIRQVAQGLEHAHENNFIHRDIKPANIMLAADGAAKILDLGLSKNIVDDDAYNTIAGVAVGTPHYMSPEQACAKAVDGRADIYSMGATLYHLVCGRPPFLGTERSVIIEQQVNSKAPKPSEINPEVPEIVSLVIERMLAKNPDDRYQNCSSLIADIDQVMNGRSPKFDSPESACADVELKSSSIREKVTPAPKSPPPTRTANKVAPPSAVKEIKPPKEKHTAKGSANPAQNKPAKQKTSPVLLVLAGLIFAAGAAMLAYAVFGEDYAAPAQPFNQPAPVKLLPPAANAAPPPAAAVPPSAPAVQPAAINLIPFIETKRDGILGNWQVTNGALITSQFISSR